MQNTIFVNIASFIDYDLRYTILSCINQARYPENLFFGVNLQYSEEPGCTADSIDDLVRQYNIKIIKYPHDQSLGGCWARNKVAYLYHGEKYQLQLDAHIRMVKDWDVQMIEQHEELVNAGVKKPIISYLSPLFMKHKELGVDYYFTHIDEPQKINVPKIESICNDYFPNFNGYTNELDTENKNRNVSILYCGFVFSSGNWTIEIRNDPEHYYTGEEFALSIRSFTHGWDIYQPKRIVSWHKSTNQHDPVHRHHYHVFEDHSHLHRRAMERLKALIFEEDFGEYGLGKVRTIQQYEEFAKLDIKNLKVLG